ncbi:MAG: sugar hydrolase [Actinobacteria bacterium 13_1_20CM_3_71_11]|nr:MAG: sugar hydrolase [Actinobacteria bacterium 13_1_20CM_3_71_11]
MRRLWKLLAALAVTVPVLVAVAPAHAAPLNLLPLRVTNDSGRGDKVYLYVLGVNLNTGRLGYVDAAGTFTPWPAGSLPPVPAPDVSIAGPAPGATRALKLPVGISGRMYMSFGAKLKFFLTPDGLVQPAPWAPQDPNRDILFDWSELTYNSGGLWINTSMVDMFSVPHMVTLTTGSGGTLKTGELKPGGRAGIFAAIASQPGDWGKLIDRRSDGTLLRVQSPLKGVERGVFSATYFDSYVTTAWNTYRSATLTVAPFENQPGTNYLGRTDGSGNLNFTDPSGARVYTIHKPSTTDVFGCAGNLAAPNDLVAGPIARTVCAALHRTTLAAIHTQPSLDPNTFYRTAVTDHYSRILHSFEVDGKAYGFAFDDVGHFEALVHDGAPRSVQVTLTPF